MFNEWLGFRIDKETFNKFKDKHNNVSEALRSFVKREIEGISEVNREDINILRTLILSNPSSQVYGNIGIGKTHVMKKLIQSDNEHIYIVIDSHNEYDFLSEITTVNKDVKQSSRIIMPKNENEAQPRFNYSLYSDIVREKLPDNFIIVVDEAHRYPKAKKLLMEARKFVRVVTISPEPLGSFCPSVEIVK